MGVGIDGITIEEEIAPAFGDRRLLPELTEGKDGAGGQVVVDKRVAAVLDLDVVGVAEPTGQVVTEFSRRRVCALRDLRTVTGHDRIPDVDGADKRLRDLGHDPFDHANVDRRGIKVDQPIDRLRRRTTPLIRGRSRDAIGPAGIPPVFGESHGTVFARQLATGRRLHL